MLEGKTAFITGTNRGLGRAMLQEFAKQGVNIVAHARKETPEFLDFVSSISKNTGVKIYPVFFDLTDYVKIKETVRWLVSNNIPVNILINNAGVIHGGLFQMTPMAKIRDVFEVNLFAQMELTQQLLRYIIRCKNGSIINIASVSGLDVTVANCAYGVSKAAFIAFTKTLAAEVGTLGVRVNAIAPCLTDTDMADIIDSEAKKRMIDRCDLNRIAKPDEIAKVAIFLASDQSSFVSGQVLRVDGGKGRILE